MRSETQLAADVVIVLVVCAVIDRKRWTPMQLANAVGCSVEELEDARRRHQSDGLNALMPDADTETAAPTHDSRRQKREPRSPLRERRYEHPGERQCSRCGEWFPIEMYAGTREGDPRPLDGYRRKMCPVCFGEFERGHFIAVQKTVVFEELAAFFTTQLPDDSVGARCPVCEEPIVAGDDVQIRGIVEHTKCGKGKR